ncbi:MAG: helix-turn-helix domain-containing protein, partial [Bryobacteraceae bacterium]
KRLREEREKRGLSIDELARQTRIHARYFEAIERDDIASLPGGFFYRSFLRQYARLLGIPEEVYQPEIERSLAEEAGRPYTVPERHIDVPPLPTPKGSRREEVVWWAVRAGGLLLTVAACTGLYIGWERWKHSQAVPAAAQQQAPTAAQPSPMPATAPAAPVLSPQQTQETALAPASAVAAVAGSPVRVVVRASELTWVGVWQGRKFLFGDLMRPGEVRGFGGDDVLRLKIGNAGGVRLEWNGKEMAPIGPRGQVRTIEFRRDSWEVIQPGRPTADAEAPPDGAQP